MGKSTKLALVVIILLLVGAGLVIFPKTSRAPQQVQTIPQPTVAATADNFSYKGQAEVDALTLLKEKATIEQDNSGLVVSINNKKAETSKREYWAFYVNGTLSNVGPASYTTSDSDTIDWKIETY
ncbi:DUF4430 domain-containing protein [Candidatus Microgenomates bacterium]|nr:DUF4430 domain-containing protein [Candidatus Microgenomates bacterium]